MTGEYLMEHLAEEKEIKLNMEQICMIEDFAAQAANDGGFMSRYVFERAILVFAAVVLYPDRKEEITEMIGKDYDIRAAYQVLLETGLLEEMANDYQKELTWLLCIGDTWFEEAKDFEQSARGLLSTISDLSGDIVQGAFEKLQEAANGDAKIVEDFARQWGYGRVASQTTDKATLELVE